MCTEFLSQLGNGDLSGAVGNAVDTGSNAISDAYHGITGGESPTGSVSTDISNANPGLSSGSGDSGSLGNSAFDAASARGTDFSIDPRGENILQGALGAGSNGSSGFSGDPRMESVQQNGFNNINYTPSPVTGAGGGAGSDGGGTGKSDQQSLMERIFGTSGKDAGMLKNATSIASLLGLGTQALRSTAPSPYSSELAKQATNLGTMGSQLTNPLLKGSALPAGAQAGIDRSATAQKAAIRSKYASLGMSGSSSELTDLNAIEQNIAAQQFSIADALAQQGLTALGMSNTEYNQLAKNVLTQDTEFTQALAGLSGALNGSKGVVK